MITPRGSLKAGSPANDNKPAVIPASFHLQWHLTERCNLRCSHCYMDKELIKDEMGFDKVRPVLYQYLALMKEWDVPRARTKVSFTGGEPFLRADLFDILAECLKNRELTRYGLLTNGLFLSDENVGRLRALKVDYIQVSIEGAEDTNDAIRGKGSYLKAVEGLERLFGTGIDTVISVTVHKKNLKDIPAMISLARRLRVKAIGLRRLVPWGRARDMKEFMLSPPETRELFESVTELKNRFPDIAVGFGCEDGIFAQGMHYVPTACVCGRSALTLLPNGHVYPCRRLPILAGDVKTTPLKDIFEKSELLEKIRRVRDFDGGCLRCQFFNECLGGGLCVSYAYWGHLGKCDPQCWKRFEALPPRTGRRTAAPLNV